jgi:hypothetical protein
MYFAVFLTAVLMASGFKRLPDQPALVIAVSIIFLAMCRSEYLKDKKRREIETSG